mmetsp:Transcript_1892/g.5597  ORF Transcript_1892/g.5597 Transcript_1892/m.5597 type:complete len:261 (+) Transcript_1892:388-1170(+)
MTPGTGLYASQDQHRADDVSKTALRTFGSTPCETPRAKASAVPSICSANERLFASLTARPAPTGPQCIGVLPMCFRRGAARANASSVAPTMKASVAASAPTAPPDTGASTYAQPPASALAASARAVGGSMVEQSTISVSGPQSGSAASTTALTWSPFWSMVKIVPPSHCCASAAGDAAAAAPSGTLLRSKSCATTDAPAFTKFRAIGRPMFPRPTKPTRAAAAAMVAARAEAEDLGSFELRVGAASFEHGAFGRSIKRGL